MRRCPKVTAAHAQRLIWIRHKIGLSWEAAARVAHVIDGYPLLTRDQAIYWVRKLDPSQTGKDARACVARGTADRAKARLTRELEEAERDAIRLDQQNTRLCNRVEDLERQRDKISLSLQRTSADADAAWRRCDELQGNEVMSAREFAELAA